MIDFSFENSLKPQRGSLLVAEPFMNDSYFARAVVLLCDHTEEEGSFGFVLNNYVELNLEELVEDFPQIQTKVSIGGPVDTSNLFYIHRIEGIPDSLEASNGVYFGGEFETIKEILKATPERAKDVRFFIGYSGWSKGQLDEEMVDKSWVVVNEFGPELIFDTNDTHIWKHILEKQGAKFKVMTNFPQNPSDN